jgi:carboxyl-terminal processing protease
MPIMLVLLATLAIVQFSIAITGSSPSYEWFDPLIDVRGVLVDRHVQVPDEEEMQQAAIEAMIESLDDPYALFVPDEKEKAFIKDLEGDYAGIGAEVRMIKDELHIISPMENSPALAAGIKAGDVVEMIDGELANDATITELIERLTGPAGTDVIVIVRHLNGEKEEITVTRGHIQSQSVAGIVRRNQKWSWCLDDQNGIAYIRIRQFNDTTPQELIGALNEAKSEGLIDGLVIDLRDNPGGSLSSAVYISDLFLDQGTIVTVTGRADPQRTINADSYHTWKEIPILVLVNGNSASASEIVSGSLQANDRVAILGSRTFGKGSVQEVLQLESGGMLKFTTARYDLAGGRTIDKKLSEDKSIWGVDPTAGLVIPESFEELKTRIESREPYTIITDEEPELFVCGDADWLKDTYGDFQLSQALIAIRSKISEGDWPSLSDEKPVSTGVREEVTELAKQRIEILKTLLKVDKELASLQNVLDETDESLLPEDANLNNALMTITDEEGNIIGEWVVTNGNIEAALDSLQLKPSENGDGTRLPPG